MWSVNRLVGFRATTILKEMVGRWSKEIGILLKEPKPIASEPSISALTVISQTVSSVSGLIWISFLVSQKVTEQKHAEGSKEKKIKFKKLIKAILLSVVSKQFMSQYAKHMLLNRFFVVGILEEFDKSMDLYGILIFLSNFLYKNLQN